MGQAFVTISYQASDLADAQNKLAAWTLQPECEVGLMFQDAAPAGETDDSGSVVPKPDPPDPAPLDEV